MKKIVVIILVCLGLGVQILCAQAQQKQEFLGLGYIANKYLALIKNDGLTLDILDLNGLKIASRSFSENERALSFVLHKDSIFLGKMNGNVSEFLFQPTSGKLTENDHFKVSDCPITALTYSGGILTAGDQNGKITLFSIKKPRTEKIVGGYPKTAITHLAQTSVGTLSLTDTNMKPRVWRENKIAGLLNADSPQGLVAMNNKAAIYTTETVLLFSVDNSKFGLGKTVKLPPNTAPVTGGGFSTDSLLKYLLLSTQDGALIVNTGTGEVVAQHRGLGPSAAAWRPDNRQYAIWSDNRIRFFDAPDRPVAKVTVISDMDVDLLIKGTTFEPTTIQLLNGMSKNMRIDTGPVEFSLVDPKSGKIVSADSNIEVRRLDLVENEPVSLVVKKNEPVPVQQSPAAGKVVAKDSGSAIPAHTVRASNDVLLAGFGEKTAIIDFGKGAVSQITSQAVPAAMDISSDNKHVFLACGNKLQTYTVEGRELGRLDFDSAVTALARLDGPLAAVAAGSCLYIVDGLEGKIRIGPINFGAEISTLAVHKDRLAVGGVNGDVAFINTTIGRFESRILGLRTPAVTALCWLDNGAYIAASYADGLTLVVNASSGTRTIDPIQGPGPVRTLSTNGNRLCIAYDNAINVVDLSSGLVQEFPGTKSAAFWSGQANRLAVTGKNGVEFYIGNTKSGEFRLYPTGDWLLVSTPVYNYSYSYYMTSNEALEDSLVEVQDFYEKKTRPLTADDRKQFRGFKELIRSLGENKMKSVIIAACALILPAIQIPAQAIRSSYLGVLLLQNNDIVDIFGIDSDPGSVFHSGGLRSLNKAQVEGLLSRLRADVIRNQVGGGTKLFDGAALAIETIRREADSLPANASFRLIFISDGFDTASKNAFKTVKQILGEPIGAKRITSYSIAVSGDKGSPNTTVLKALASQPENYWSLSDEELTNKKLLEIAQPASGESPVIFFVIDQSGSLKSKSSIIERAVEKTIRELFEKTDRLVKIPGWRAAIGSPPTEPDRDEDETLFHPVVESFYLSPYLFTQREYEEVWGAGSNPSAVHGPDLPVTNISWYRAVETLNKLSEQKGFTPVYTITRDGGNIVGVEWDTSADGYRLPTEIEWEFACRAGTTTPFYTGTSINKQQANIKGSAPTAVGKYPPNGLGLYDIIGNVKEFCFDIFGRYPSDEGDVFEAVGNERVNRGGSFANWDDATLRSAYRSYDDPNTTSSILGFRVARNFVE